MTTTRKILLAVAAVLVAASVAACANGGGSAASRDVEDAATTSTTASAPTGCRVGEPVGHPIGDNAPSCADGPSVSVLSYGCYPPNGPHSQQRGSFYLVSYPGRSLYGKPGGVWRAGRDPDTLDRAAITKIGC